MYALKGIVVGLVLGVIMLSGEPTRSAPSARGSSIDSVVAGVYLTHAEADSLVAMIDRLDFTIEILQADVWEARELGRIDSLYAEQLRARLESRERWRWLDTIVRNPAIWFMLGAWAGLRAFE